MLRPLAFPVLIVGCALTLTGCGPGATATHSQNRTIGTPPPTAPSGRADARERLVGTWERTERGKPVQVVRFGADGQFQMDYPEAPANDNREAGKYDVSADVGKVSFDSAGVKYAWTVRFNGADELNGHMDLGRGDQVDFTFHRKK
jgi:hypothetical protein